MAEVAKCSECRSEMDVTAAGPYSRVVCPNCQAEIRVKLDFGNYLLQKRLAFGGMSALFIALDKTLDRQVALKVLNEEYSQNESRVAQFEKEAELTALVNHPNVVRVYSVGRAFGRFYIAMELIVGKSLEQRIAEKKKLTEKEILKIAIQATAGLHAAKSAGLIHRDVKPGNILVDEEGVAKIVDFGLSLTTLSGTAQATEIFGTPYYASPESLTAGVEDFRSDIYALGATLYHAFSGKTPIKTSSMQARELLTAKHKIPALRVVAPRISQSTSDLVERMMAFQKEERYGSYEKLTLGLKRALAKEVQPSRTNDSVDVSGGNHSHLIVWLGGTLILLVGVAVFLWQNVSRDSDKEEKGISSQTAEGASGSESEAKIGEIYRLARQKLREGNFNEAEVNFLRLYRREDISQPAGIWAGVEAALCALLDGRSDDARRVFARLKERAEDSALETRTRIELGTLLQEWPSFSRFQLAQSFSSDPELALLEFARLLKNWETGEVSLGPQFQSFADLDFQDRADWLESYQEWARQLAFDAQVLANREPNWDEEWTPSSLVSEQEHLNEVSQKLKTNGRSQFTLQSWQDWLESERARLELEKE